MTFRPKRPSWNQSGRTVHSPYQRAGEDTLSPPRGVVAATMVATRPARMTAAKTMATPPTPAPAAEPTLPTSEVQEATSSGSLVPSMEAWAEPSHATHTSTLSAQVEQLITTANAAVMFSPSRTLAEPEAASYPD